MATIEHYDSEEALLEHYGLKGMKWGVRKGRDTTGVSRTRGAAIDRNDRVISRIQKAQKGKGGGGLLRDRIAFKVENIAMGKKSADRYRKVKIQDMRDQNRRLKSGKANVRDKLQMLMTTTPIDLVLSNRPK